MWKKLIPIIIDTKKTIVRAIDKISLLIIFFLFKKYETLIQNQTKSITLQ